MSISLIYYREETSWKCQHKNAREDGAAVAPTTIESRSLFIVSLNIFSVLVPEHEITLHTPPIIHIKFTILPSLRITSFFNPSLLFFQAASSEEFSYKILLHYSCKQLKSDFIFSQYMGGASFLDGEILERAISDNSDSNWTWT